MNFNSTEFRWFSNLFVSYALDERRLRIEKVNPFNAAATFTQSTKDAMILGNHLNYVMFVFSG